MNFAAAVRSFIAALKSGDTGPVMQTARRDRLAAVMGATPEDIGAAMRRALTGDQEGFAQLCAIFDNYLLKEPRLRAVVEKRRRKIIQWPWRVVPADPEDRTSVADAEFLESVFRGIPRFSRSVLWELTDAIGKGLAAVQIEGAVRGGRLVVARASGVPQWSLRHPADPATGALDMSRWEHPGANTTLGWRAVPDGKLLVWRREEQGSYITGGLMWPTLWYACFKNFTIKDWLAFIEVYGIPIRIGKVPSEFKPGSREWEVVATAVMNAASDSGAIISKDAEINIMDAMKGAASDSFKTAAQYFDDAQAELWLGGTLTTSAGEKGARSLGDVHLDEEYALIIPDTDELAEVLTEFGSYLVAANFGERPAYPRFEFDVRLPKDIEAESRAIAPILALGVPIDLDGLYETFMPWAKPREGGNVFRASSPTNPASPAGTAGLTLSSLPPLAATPAVPADDLVEGLAASGGAAAAAIYDAFIEALDDAGAAPDAARRAFEAGLADVLAALIGAGRLAGAQHGALEAGRADDRVNVNAALTEAVAAVSAIPAALSASSEPQAASLASVDLSGDGPILPRDESGRIVWSKVLPRRAMEWWAARTGVTAAEYRALDESAKDRAFMIAGVESETVVTAAQNEIARALAEGTTAADFRKSMKAAGWTADKAVMERVFTQNILSAYGAGRDASQRSAAVSRYLPHVRLFTAGDSDVRPEHARLAGIVMRADDPDRPPTPLYYGCRCEWRSAPASVPLTDPSRIVWPTLFGRGRG